MCRPPQPGSSAACRTGELMHAPTQKGAVISPLYQAPVRAALRVHIHENRAGTCFNSRQA